jgi:hypothetical protein
VLICVAIAACAPASSSELSIDRVVPSSAAIGDSVVVRIEGAGFHIGLMTDLDRGTTEVGEMVVSVGGMTLTDAVRRGEELIEATIPAGLPVGMHDVVVAFGERRRVLERGFTVNPSCVATFLDVCSQPVPAMSLDISTALVIDTDTDPLCTSVAQADGTSVCLVYATSVTIESQGSLTATGSRPLAIASMSTMVIDGLIDVSSLRGGQPGPAADDARCTFAAIPESDLGGAGGGAGGSFGAVAGNGGTGDTNQDGGTDGTSLPGGAGPLATIAELRGGCAGQKGGDESSTGGQGAAGGHSGGALYLVANDRVDVVGTIRATGAGGEGGPVRAGGGGGGSGGLVVIESPSISIAGQISANGGGGGGGGAFVGNAPGTPVAGQPGADGDVGTTPALGGIGATGGAGGEGPGGAGGADATPPTPGGDAGGGGGGGGGAVGVIKLIGTAAITGLVSPAPS